MCHPLHICTHIFLPNKINDFFWKEAHASYLRCLTVERSLCNSHLIAMKLCNSVHLLLVARRANYVATWKKFSTYKNVRLGGNSSWFDRKTLRRQFSARDRDIRLLEGITILIMGTIPSLRGRLKGNWRHRQNISIFKDSNKDTFVSNANNFKSVPMITF